MEEKRYVSFYNYVTFFFFYLRISTWQEVLKEEFENRSSNWRPFEEGKRYETFSAEERVSIYTQSSFFAGTTAATWAFCVTPVGHFQCRG